MAEMGAIEGKPARNVAEQLLMDAAWVNGLVKDYSKAKCRETIADAYRWIAQKYPNDVTHSHSTSTRRKAGASMKAKDQHE